MRAKDIGFVGFSISFLVFSKKTPCFIETDSEGAIKSEQVFKHVKREYKYLRDANVQITLIKYIPIYFFKGSDGNLKVFESKGGKSVDAKDAKLNKRGEMPLLAVHWHNNIYIGVSNVIEHPKGNGKDENHAFNLLKMEW